MRVISRSKPNNTVLAAILIFISACATSGPRIPIFLDEDFKQRQPKAIVVMPVVDARKDRSIEVNLETDVLQPTRSILEQKGYSVTLSPRFSDGKEIVPEEVVEMQIQELAHLGPPEAQTLVFIYLDDLQTQYAVMYKTVKVELSAVMVQKDPPKYLWRDKDLNSVGQGGLISGLVVNQAQTIQGTLNKLFTGFPERQNEK